MSNKGRTTALQAALLAKPMPVKMARCYTTTGWRTLNGRDVFVHGSGGIDAAGSVDICGMAARPLNGTDSGTDDMSVGEADRSWPRIEEKHAPHGDRIWAAADRSCLDSLRAASVVE